MDHAQKTFDDLQSEPPSMDHGVTVRDPHRDRATTTRKFVISRKKRRALASVQCDLSHPSDTAVHRVTIDEMPDEDAMAYIAAIRDRRLKACVEYQSKRQRKCKAEIEDHLGRLNKELAAAEKSVAKLERRARIVRVLALDLTN